MLYATQIMDGLSRREVEFNAQFITRDRQPSSSTNQHPSSDLTIKAYIVGGRDVTKSWSKTASVIIVCPDEEGWRSKSNRVIADELAFTNQAIVIIPDLYNTHTDSTPTSTTTDTNNKANNMYTNDKQSLYYKQIIDTIISTCHYSRQQFRPNSISIIGTGNLGSYWALQSACILWDIACYSNLQLQMEEVELRSMYEGKIYIYIWLFCTLYKCNKCIHCIYNYLLDVCSLCYGHIAYIRKIILYVHIRYILNIFSTILLYLYIGVGQPEHVVKMLNTTVALGYAERVPLNATYDNIEYTVWDEEVGEGVDVGEERGSDRGGVSDVVVSTEEAIRTIKSAQTVTAPSDTFTPTTTSTPTTPTTGATAASESGEGEGEERMSDAEMDELMNTILDKASKEFDPIPTSSTTSTTKEEEVEERELMKTRKQTRINKHNRLLKIQQLREEKRQQEDIYIQTAAQRVIKSRLVSKRSTLKPSDLVHIAPRSLVCFHQPSPTTGIGHNSDPHYTPEMLDMIATSLRIPSMFVFTTHPSTTDTSTTGTTDNSNNSISGCISSSSIRALHSTLIRHQAGIEDFSIRVYEGRIMTGGEAGDGRYMTHPIDEFDQKIRQVCVYLLNLTMRLLYVSVYVIQHILHIFTILYTSIHIECPPRGRGLDRRILPRPQSRPH